MASAILPWLAHELGLPMPSALPRLVLVDQAEMRRLRGSDGVPADAFAGVDLVAIYDTRSQTIHLPRGWTGATPAEMSILVHEMVHHLQAENGQRFACPAEREKAAFSAQRRWLELFGTGLEQAFAINPMFLLVATTCAP